MNEYGVAHYSNGDVYEGYFKSGEMNGLGLYYEAEKKQYTLAFYTRNVMQKSVEQFADKVVGFSMQVNIL